MTQYFPLYHFYSTLRTHKDFSLGLEEYFSLIEVFQKDEKYQKDGQQLLNLCRFLWLKPGQSENLFVSLFHQSFEVDKEMNNTSEESKETPTNNDNLENDTLDKEKQEDPTYNPQEEEDEEVFDSNNKTEVEELYLNIIDKNLGQSATTTTEEKLVEDYKIHLLDKHIVLKERQLKQRWRTLKKIVNGRLKNQIDIPSTILQIGQKGVLIEPIFQRETINTASLMTLVDNQGSMVAFKGLTTAFIQTATKGAKIDNTVFYFNNLPKLNEEETDFYLYKSPAHTSHSELIKELQLQLFQQKDIVILIISDGGAARGNLNLDRLNATIQILQVLKYFSFKIVWLNPVPENRWKGTTAALIKDFVPMFEANEKGLKEGIEILRGKIPATSRLFYDEITMD